MNRKLILILALSSLLVCFQFLTYHRNEVNANEVYPIHNLNTGLNYATIQQAINANETRDGDVVHVDAGTYLVNSTVYNFINKSISLIGDGMENTTIIGTASVPLFYVTSDHVTISGFSLQNGWYGVQGSANYVHINECNISNNGIGINLYNPLYQAPLLEGETIDRNILMNNSMMAIQVAANDSTISLNLLSENGGGISVFDGNNNIVYGNTIRNTGRSHMGCGVAGQNNTIILNNFLNNTIQALAFYNSTNTWNGGLSAGDLLWGGNFWSDYNETNKYGLGTDPYVIDANNIDYRPLTGMVNIFDVPYGYDVAVVSNSTISDFQFTLMNQSQATLDFRVAGDNGTQGFCWIIVPQALFDYTQTLKATLDGSILTTHEYSRHFTNSTHWNFWIDYSHSEHQIDIQGVATIPEFPQNPISLLLLTALLLTVLVYRRRRFTHNGTRFNFSFN